MSVAGRSTALTENRLLLQDTGKKIQSIAADYEVIRLIKDKQDEIDRNRHWKAFSAFFGGAAKTGTAAYNIGTTFYEGATYNTTLGGNK